MRSSPLRQLSSNALTKFSMKALTTWGNEDEFRHYLPRMLELIVCEPGWTEITTLFGKLRTGDWRTWPCDEQRAIETYFVTLWRAMLRGEIDVSLADLALGASNAGLPLGEAISLWRQSTGVDPALQLAYLILLERNELLHSGTFGHRWSDETRQELATLVHSAECRQRLEDAFFQLEDPAQVDIVSRAVGILDTMMAVAS